jgi:uncharacterized protein
LISPRTCPICSKALPIEAGAKPTYFPFCSERCRQVDLLRWRAGKYAIVEPVNSRDADAGAIEAGLADADE